MALDDLLSRLLQTGLMYPDLTHRRAKMFGGIRIASHPLGVHFAFVFSEIPEELRKLEDGKNSYIGSSNQERLVYDGATAHAIV